MSIENSNIGLFKKELFPDLINQLKRYHNKGLLFVELTEKNLKLKKNGDIKLNVCDVMFSEGNFLKPQRDIFSWKKKNRAPEYRNSCLRGEPYYPTRTGDIYSLVYCLIQLYLGDDRRTDHIIERKWFHELYDIFDCRTEEEKAALCKLLSRCTMLNKYQRIQSCEQLMDTKEFQLLFHNGSR